MYVLENVYMDGVMSDRVPQGTDQDRPQTTGSSRFRRYLAAFGNAVKLAYFGAPLDERDGKRPPVHVVPPML